MTSTRTERPSGLPQATPGISGGIDTPSRPADLTADQLALTHRADAGLAASMADSTTATRNGPVAHPPGTAGAATDQVSLAGTWQTKQILALFNTRNSRNGWAYLDGVGWRRLATTSDSAHMGLGILASAARASGRPVVARDEADGQLHEIYFW
jgi:hypothetical protein